MENQQLTIKELLGAIKRRPGMFLGEREGRIDYLSHFLNGWLGNGNHDEINRRYQARIAYKIYEWIEKNKKEKIATIKFTFNWYEMIYSVTSTEKEAWELFFRISDEYIEQLEAKTNQKPD